MDKTDRNTIEELLPRYCEGVATEEERLQVEMWMSESDENRRMAKQIHALYLATDTVHIMTKVDTEKALTKVKSRMTGNRQRKTTWWEWAQRAAAVLFIPLLVTLMVQHWGGSEQELAQMMEVKTNPGMMTSLTLPDGTLVFLNSESTLSYPSRFDSDTRNVTLQGEAYFQVASDKSSPFIIEMGKVQVQVLGTSFNLRAYQDEEMIQTTLVEGRVCMFTDKKRILLYPNEQGAIELKTGNLVKKQVDVQAYIGWKNGRFIFERQTLEDIMRTLSRWYDVQVVFQSEKARHIEFTGNLRRYDDFGQIVSMLALACLAKFNVSGTTIYIAE